MPHDYKDQNTSKAEPTSGSNGFLWGLLIGLSVAAVLWFVNQDKEDIAAAQPATPPQAVEVAEPEPAEEVDAIDEAPATEDAVEPKREPSPFAYLSLKEFEVVISPEELARSTPPPAETPDDSPNGSSANRDAAAQYKIQIGSFRSIDDAERRRSEIGFIGLVSSMESVEIGPGQVWHRVYVGPLSNAREIDDTLDILAGNGFDFLVRKAKNLPPQTAAAPTPSEDTAMESPEQEAPAAAPLEEQ